ALACAKACQNGLEGAKDDEDVQGQGAVFDVIEIQLYLETCRISAGCIPLHDLRPASDTGTHDVAVAVERDFLVKAFDKGLLFRSWTDQTHLTLEHVDELRYLVDSQLANDVANARDPLIILTGK